jgi:hypothetical protein
VDRPGDLAIDQELHRITVRRVGIDQRQPTGWAEAASMQPSTSSFASAARMPPPERGS